MDVAQTVIPGERIRWDYTLILRGADTAIQFETIQTGSEGAAEGVGASAFRERLEARGQLLVNGSYTVQRNVSDSEAFGGSVIDGDSIHIFYRLSGKYAQGQPVRVDVRFTLHAGLGIQTAGSRSAGSTTASMPAESASAGSAQLAHERIGVEATLLERALLDDLQDRSLDRHSPLDAALIVSGARDREELDALRRRFEDAAAPILKRLGALATPGDRAPALLGALHPTRTSQTPLLREYSLDATTLIDVIESGRYNCVSATIVYWLLGSRIGLDTNPVLLPSHARAVVRIVGRRVPVEATTPYGYDPTDVERREIQRRFRARVDRVPARVDEEERDVDFLALLGAVYTNIATLRTRDGNVSAAAAVASRADAFVGPTERAVLNQVRIGLLNEIAVDRSRRGRHEEAVGALLEAKGLAMEGDETGAFLTDSLTEVALTWLQAIEPSADDATVLGFSDRLAEASAVKAEVRSYTLRLVAHRRMQRAQWEEARADLREAAILTRTAEQRDQIARELAHAELGHVETLATRDVERAWQEFQALPRDADDEELRSARRLVSHRLVVLRLQHFSNQHRCEELDELLALWRDLDADANPDHLRAGCHGQRGVKRWRSGQIDQAADDFRRAHRLAPRDPTMEHNLIAALQGLIAGHMREGRCRDARPLIAEGRSLAPNDPFFQQAARTCGSGPEARGTLQNRPLHGSPVFQRNSRRPRRGTTTRPEGSTR